MAAHQMWQRLQDLPLDSQDDTTDDVSIHNLHVLISIISHVERIFLTIFHNFLSLNLSNRFACLCLQVHTISESMPFVSFHPESNVQIVES